MSRAWKVLSSAEIFKTPYIRLRADKCELPDGRVMPNYYVLEFPDWVNIVPVTEDNKIVLVEQYRQAIGETTLEIPGGSTDPGVDEDPKKAALRELLEETGYVSDDVRLLGVHSPNPALQNNKLHTFVAFGCWFQQEPQLDPYEDIRVVTLPIPDVIDKIFTGEINHTLIVASLLYSLPVLGFHLPMNSVRSTSK